MAATNFIQAELRALPENVEETRTVEFVISNETRDRHGTVLRADKWDLANYKRNPVVGYSHALHGSFFGDVDPDTVIGKGEVFMEGKNMIGRVMFEPAEINPLAEKIFQKVKFGSLRSASVGFSPKGEPEYGKGTQAKGQPNETLYYPGQELLEWSIVNIPSNPTAVKREMADDLEDFLENAAKALEGKHTVEELRKMTLKGVISLMTGEGIEEDKQETEESQQIDNELETKRRRQLGRYQVDAAFHNNFKPLDIEEDNKRKSKERQRRDFFRNKLKYFTTLEEDKNNE